MDYECDCSESCGQSNAILFNILSRGEPAQNEPNSDRVPDTCSCENRRNIGLKTPEETCRKASSVMVKTMNFLRSLPAFQQLLPKDQLSLLQNGWAPVFILGLAQDGFRFEIEDIPAPRMLERILLNDQDASISEREQPTLAGIQTLTSCLKKFWSLDLSPKEYAYLKGTILFNPSTSY